MTTLLSTKGIKISSSSNGDYKSTVKVSLSNSNGCAIVVRYGIYSSLNDALVLMSLQDNYYVLKKITDTGNIVSVAGDNSGVLLAPSAEYARVVTITFGDTSTSFTLI